MKATAEQRLDIVDSLARGIPVQDALRKSGLFSKTTVSSMAWKTIASKSFRRTMREYAETLSERIEDLAPAELATLRLGTAPAAECVAALRGVFAAYNQKANRKELRALSGGQAITKAFAERWSPEAAAKKAELLERARLIKPGDLTNLVRAGIEDELLDPPTDARARTANRRLALESEGVIGNNPGALHFHQHQELNINNVPPSVLIGLLGLRV